jgi:hypothetical protein
MRTSPPTSSTRAPTQLTVFEAEENGACKVTLRCDNCQHSGYVDLLNFDPLQFIHDISDHKKCSRCGSTQVTAWARWE